MNSMEWAKCPRLDIKSRVLPAALKPLCDKCRYYREGKCKYRELYNPLLNHNEKR
jgi:hypothetical protein